jgi:hypothetical protein
MNSYLHLLYFIVLIYTFQYIFTMSRDSAVGIATGYGLDN